MRMFKSCIAVAAHDAGGAELISSLVAKYRHRYSWRCFAAGPAINIFKRKRIPLEKTGCLLASDIRTLFAKIRPSFLLVGTGWSTRFERLMMSETRKLGIPAAAYLDGWYNFRQRFQVRSNPVHYEYPDLFLAGDRFAYRTALKEGLPRRFVKRVENPYWESFESRGVITPRKKYFTVLYLLQANSGKFKQWSQENSIPDFPTFSYLDDLVMAVKRLALTCRLIVRPHPTEDIKLLERKIFEIRRGGVAVDISGQQIPLLRDIRRSDVAIGFETIALVIAHVVGKKAIIFSADRKISRLPFSIPVAWDEGSLYRKIRANVRPCPFLKQQARFNRFFPFSKVVRLMTGSQAK